MMVSPPINQTTLSGQLIRRLCDMLGSAYLLYASDNNQNFKITHLDANYYNVTTVASQLNGRCQIAALPWGRFLTCSYQVPRSRPRALSSGTGYVSFSCPLRARNVTDSSGVLAHRFAHERVGPEPEQGFPGHGASTS